MKTLVIDAIVGGGFANLIVATECEKVGLAEFCGNPWEPDWRWNRRALEECELPTLQELYESLREKRGIPMTEPAVGEANAD